LGNIDRKQQLRGKKCDYSGPKPGKENPRGEREGYPKKNVGEENEGRGFGSERE